MNEATEVVTENHEDDGVQVEEIVEENIVRDIKIANQYKLDGNAYF